MYKSGVLLAVLVCAICCSARPCHAYQKDVHFNLTFVLCRLAGLQPEDALWVAAADQSMDDNDTTTAYSKEYLNLKTVWIHHAASGRNFHDFSDAGAKYPHLIPPPWPHTITYSDGGELARAAIKKRKDELWDRTLQNPITTNDDTRIKADIALGQFLHAEQDYFSHRQITPTELDNNAYLPYGTFWGHAADGTDPDNVALRVGLARRMVADNYDYIAQFAGHMRASIKAPRLSNATLEELIDAVAASYTHKYVLTKKSTGEVFLFPEQDEINNNLKSCIEKAFPSNWSGSVKLPAYSENLTLPYDRPQTPLRTEMKTIQDVAASLK